MDKQNEHIDDNSIARYIDWLRKQGSKPEQTILDHVADCTECKEEILELAEILDEEDKRVKTGKTGMQNLRMILRAVAVLVGVVLVAIAIELLRPDETDIQVVEDTEDSLELESKDNILPLGDSIIIEEIVPKSITVLEHDSIKYAGNFTTNPGLELLIKAQFRSQSDSALSSILLVKDSYLFGDTLHFDFSDFEKDDIHLTLISNAGDNKSERSKLNNESQVLTFEPGLYYWKLSTSEDLLAIGKFFLWHQTD